MFETIADQTNAYVRDRISSIMCGRDLIQQLDDPTNKKHNRLHSWKDLNEVDIKLFMAHVIVISLVCKSAVYGYWSNRPVFGKNLSRNKFQTILWHLHFNDVLSNPAPGLPGHDPLACLRNIRAMAQYNFKHVYIPSTDVTINKSTCTFQGRVKFLQYNKSKPDKFHIKLFMVSEQQTGYMSAFSIYTGSECNKPAQRNATMDPSCSITTKTVMGCLDSGNLLDVYRCVWFDNWFNSVELLLEMLARDMYGVGTVRTNRKDLPKAVVGKHVKQKKMKLYTIGMVTYYAYDGVTRGQLQCYSAQHNS